MKYDVHIKEGVCSWRVPGLRYPLVASPAPPNPAPPHANLLALLPFQLRDGTSAKTQSDGWCEEGSWKVRYGREKYWGKKMLGGRMLGK